jgi:hypothetical protein
VRFTALATGALLVALAWPLHAQSPAPSPATSPTPSPSSPTPSSPAPSATPAPASSPLTELPDEPDDPDDAPARPLPVADDPSPPAPRASTSPSQPRSQRPAENYVRDDAQVFPAAVTVALTRTVQSLEGKAELFVVTKVIDDMALFDQASQAAFKDIVDEVNHYRVIVVFIAYNSARDRGIVSTNLGYGVFHILTAKDCQNLFGNGDVPLTFDAIKTGVEKLVSIITDYHKRNPDSPQAPVFTGLDNFLRNGPRALAAMLVLLAGAWFWRRGSNCPKCGAPLKTRVSISLATTRTGRMAKKTYKCFRCGYTRRQSLVPTGYSDAETRAGPRLDEEPAEAGAEADRPL